MIKLEGEDAKRFLEMLNGEPTEAEVKTYRRAMEFYKRYHPDPIDSLTAWLKERIKECDTEIEADIWFPNLVLFARKRAFEDVLRWLDDRRESDRML